MTWEIDIENVAGILDGRATIEPGVNAVRASNWQGKSSFIASIETALGVSKPLTEGKDSGRVHLETTERSIDVELRGENGTVQRTGQPYLTDEYDVIRTGLFACLTETNEIRRAVREGRNLEDVLLGPLDFENIDEQITQLKREREQVASELSQAEEANKRLTGVREKVTRLQSELSDLEDRRVELSPGDDSVDGPSNAQNELAEAQSERTKIENQIERLERSIERTETRLEEKRSALEEIEIDDETDLESNLATAREQLQEARRDTKVLQSMYSSTEMVLQEDRLGLLTEVTRELSGDSVVCWTCGSEVTRADLETQLEELGARIATLRGTVETRQTEVEKLEARREERQQAQRRKRDLQTAVADLEEKLSDHRQSLDRARERLQTTTERIGDLSESIDESVAEFTDVESEIKYREAELADAEEELATLESRAEQAEMLRDERASLDDEIESLRNRKDEIKFEARDAFDDAIQDVLGLFDTGFEMAHLTADFELVVARDGREASLDSLSEGELELLGFVAALAGFESFDVAEVSPILLVDSIGGLDDANLHSLIEYLEERTEYLVFTAYPEHAAFDGTEIDPTEWEVATDRQVSAN